MLRKSRAVHAGPYGAFVRRPRRVAVRAARADELALVAGADAAIFGGDLAESCAWVAPQLGASRFRHWVAVAGGEPVGLATTVRSDGDAGRAAYVTGVDAFARGAELVHANPDDDAQAALLASLGGVEVPGFEVRVARDA
jgi:hypothetical protein